MASIGFCTISALDRPLEAALRVARESLADGVEVSARPPHVEDTTDLSAFRDTRAAARDHGLEILAYGSYLSCPGSDDLSSVRRDVERAAALGAPRLRVWAAHPGGSADENLGDVVAFLQSCARVAGDAGQEVVVERHAGSFADSAQRTLRLLEAVDRPNCSLNYQVLDGLSVERAGHVVEDALALVPWATYVHVKNYVAPSAEVGVLELGGDLRDGAIDYRALVAAIVEADYAGPYTIEFVAADARPLEEKLTRDVAYLRALVSESASEGET